MRGWVAVWSASGRAESRISWFHPPPLFRCLRPLGGEAEEDLTSAPQVSPGAPPGVPGGAGPGEGRAAGGLPGSDFRKSADIPSGLKRES